MTPSYGSRCSDWPTKIKKVEARRLILLQRVFMVAVHAVCVTVWISPPRLVQDQRRRLLLFAQTVLVCRQQRVNMDLDMTQKE